MPLKLLQIINEFSTGGAELMAKRLATGFDPALVRSHIWSVCSFKDPAIERRVTDDLRLHGIPHHCFRKPPHRKDPRCVAEMYRCMRRERYDVVQMHCDSPAFYGRLSASLLPGVKRVVTVHNQMTGAAVAREKVLCLLTDMYVACSSEVGLDLRQRCGFRDSRFVRILNGVEGNRAERASASRDEIRARCGVSPDERVALVLGRLNPQKAQLDVVAALARGRGEVRRLKVWIVGNDTEPYAELVRRAIAEQGVEGRCRILGMVEDGVLDELLKGADLFLLPSLYEGMSVAILEALAAGLPVVVSDLANNREITDNGRVAWLIRPGAPQELAGALESILAAPQEMRRRAAEAMRFVAEKFSFGRVVREYTELYASLRE